MFFRQMPVIRPILREDNFMRSRLWTAGMLFVAGLASILGGIWFLLGGPYVIAYALLAAGTGLFVSAVILVVLGIIGNKGAKSEHTPSQ